MRWFLEERRMRSDAMALGYGSKKSVSCDQVVIPASLDNGVSNACTTRIIWYIPLYVQIDFYQTGGVVELYQCWTEVCICRPVSIWGFCFECCLLWLGTETSSRRSCFHAHLVSGWFYRAKKSKMKQELKQMSPKISCLVFSFLHLKQNFLSRVPAWVSLTWSVGLE